MQTSSKVSITVLAVFGTVLLLQHADMAVHPALPTDMPRGANFVATGYDIQRLEPRGEWVACSTDTEQNADFCRVTDARGTVVYQGDFLPLRSQVMLPARELKVGLIDANHLWVKGPAEGGPIPVIPLANGSVLVPVADNYALADRWNANPTELRQIEGSEL